MTSAPVEVPLVVSGVDLDDDCTLDIIARHLDDQLWAEAGGIVTATVFTEGDPVLAALDAATRITTALESAAVDHVYPDLVSITSIAQRVGVSRQAARKWVTASAAAPFPQPYGVLDGEGRPVRVWRWSDVAAWLASTKGWTAEMRVDSDAAARIDAQLQTLGVNRGTRSAAPSASTGSGPLSQLLVPRFPEGAFRGNHRPARHRPQLGF